MSDLAHLRSRVQPAPAATPLDDRIIAVAAGKGGAGTSTLAALLAWLSARRGVRSLLVETQSPGSLHMRFNAPPPLRTGSSAEPSFLDDMLDLLCIAAEATDAMAGLERRHRLRSMTGVFDHYERIFVDLGSTLESAVNVADIRAATLVVPVVPDAVSLAASHALIKVTHERQPGTVTLCAANRTDEPGGTAALSTLAEGIRHFLDVRIVRAGSVPFDAAVADPRRPFASLHDSCDLINAAEAVLDVIPAPARRDIQFAFSSPRGVSS